MSPLPFAPAAGCSPPGGRSWPASGPFCACADEVPTMTKTKSTPNGATTPERRGRKSLSGALGESARLSVRVTPKQFATWHAMPDASRVLLAWLDRRARAEAKTPKAPRTSRAIASGASHVVESKRPGRADTA